MPRIRSAVAVVVCGALLAACGSTSHAAAINSALRQLQAAFERPPRNFGIPAKDVLGHLTMAYAPPPKGVSAAEWDAAIRKDQPLQRAIARSSK
jgi:hypothetical protein